MNKENRNHWQGGGYGRQEAGRTHASQLRCADRSDNAANELPTLMLRLASRRGDSNLNKYFHCGMVN